MATAIHVPRVNNNDDEVKLVQVAVSVGAVVVAGQVIGQVETDKAVADVESSCDGYVLAILGQPDEMVRVGDVLIWVGKTADEPPPAEKAGIATKNFRASTPTAKAKSMLDQHGLTADQVPASGDRLTAADVESYLDRRGQGQMTGGALPTFTPISAPPAFADGDLIALKSEEKGMLATVIWHRDTAAAGYIETTYDASVWERYAESFKQTHGLLLNPVLPLMAWRLMRLATETTKLNATIIGNKRLEYRQVNLGFTVQAGDVLYLSVLRESSKLDESAFVNALVELQRRAASHKLTLDETQGATIGFSSMARWKVSRHIPILSPNTAIMVAHTVGADGVGILGATYDHRVVHGGAVAAMLRGLSRPD